MNTSYSNGYSIVIIFVILALTAVAIDVSFEEQKLHSNSLLSRSKRQLLFPAPTVLQFNMGIGTPTPIKTIQVNWAFQANFVLPDNRSQIPVDIFYANSGYEGESRRGERGIEDSRREIDGPSYGSNAKLYHFYKYVEDILYSMGDDGRACMLQLLCQLAAEPLHSHDEEDLMHELAAFVFNPNHDVDGNGSLQDTEAKPYIEAYNHGKELRNCQQIYRRCRKSLVDLISEPYENEVSYSDEVISD